MKQKGQKQHIRSIRAEECCYRQLNCIVFQLEAGGKTKPNRSVHGQHWIAGSGGKMKSINQNNNNKYVGENNYDYQKATQALSSINNILPQPENRNNSLLLFAENVIGFSLCSPRRMLFSCCCCCCSSPSSSMNGSHVSLCDSGSDTR